MSSPLAIAPWVGTYNAGSPYITPQEYAMAPTAVDASNLVQGGNEQQNNAELMNVIGRASGIADRIVYGAQGCLAATTNIDGPDRYLVNRYGQVSFRCSYRPVLQINSISLGWTTSTLTPILASQSSDIEIHQSGIVVIPAYAANNAGGILPFTGYGVGTRILVVMSYVNGYPNTTLTDSVIAGASSIVLNNVTGIYPGTTMTIYDDFPNNEAIQVAPGYVLGATTVPLVSPLQYGHSYGTSVSNLPGDVKQAVISLTSYLIKTRGALSMVMEEISQSPSKATADDEGALQDYNDAYNLLKPFKQARA